MSAGMVRSGQLLQVGRYGADFGRKACVQLSVEGACLSRLGVAHAAEVVVLHVEDARHDGVEGGLVHFLTDEHDGDAFVEQQVADISDVFFQVSSVCHCFFGLIQG